MVINNPLENKGLLVRVTLAGHIWKRVWAWPKGQVAMARSLLLIDSLVAQTPLEFMINAEINRKIIAVWKKYFNTSNEVYGPLFYDELTKGGLVFVGVNPSFTLKGFKHVLRDTEFESIDPESFFLWSNIGASVKHVDTCVLIDRNWTHKYHSYFKKMHEMADAIKLPLQHIDVFLYKQTSQNDFLSRIIHKGKLNEFGEAQLAIFDEVLKTIEPKVIVVANAFASSIVRTHFKDVLKFDEEHGFHILSLGSRKIPIFFSSMITGQRALDTGSYERLKWHVTQAV